MSSTPWLSDIQTSLLDRFKNNILSHALMFVGAKGIGKREFANELKFYILCEKKSYCGNCKSCIMLTNNSHPDFLYVEPTNKQITIDLIRNVNEFLLKPAVVASQKYVVIEDANKLNESASNSLLKTLEEPKVQVTIVLIADKLTNILPTIKSRCEFVNFSIKDPLIVQQWLVEKIKVSDVDIDVNLLLKLTNNSPIKASSFLESKYLELRSQVIHDLCDIFLGKLSLLEYVESIDKDDIECVLEITSSVINDFIYIKNDLNSLCYNQDFVDLFVEVLLAKKSIDLSFIDKLHSVSANLQSLSNKIRLVAYNKELQLFSVTKELSASLN